MADETPDWETRDWEAWIDLMPGKDPTLHVTGTCVFPTGGYEARLELHTPQGINPKDLLLNLVVTPPQGPVPEVITEVLVTYEQPAEKGQYDTVSVTGGKANIEVKETH